MPIADGDNKNTVQSTGSTPGGAPIKNILFGVIAVLILAGIAYYATNMKKEDSSPAMSTSEEEIDQGPRDRISLGETFEGPAITVATAEFLRPGFIAVYRLDEEGIIYLSGRSDLLDVGRHENIIIPLDQPLADGESVGAVPHLDDGNSEFEFPGNDRAAAINGADIYDVSVVNAADDVGDMTFAMALEAFLATGAPIDATIQENMTAEGDADTDTSSDMIE
jgi:hypothetical protein